MPFRTPANGVLGSTPCDFLTSVPCHMGGVRMFIEMLDELPLPAEHLNCCSTSSSLLPSCGPVLISLSWP
jgi:hypothetical protein